MKVVNWNSANHECMPFLSISFLLLQDMNGRGAGLVVIFVQNMVWDGDFLSHWYCCILNAAIPLSEDHKPNRSDERQRIEQAGGNVMWAGNDCNFSYKI